MTCLAYFTGMFNLQILFIAFYIFVNNEFSSISLGAGVEGKAYL